MSKINKNNDKSIDGLFDTINEHVLLVQSEARQQIIDEGYKFFDDLKTKLSTVRVISENKKMVEKLLALKLETITTDKGNKKTVTFRIYSDKEIENKVLYAQLRGTGFKISSDVLEYLGVTETVIEKDKMSEWFFDPSDDDIKASGEFESILKRKVIK